MLLNNQLNHSGSANPNSSPVKTIRNLAITATLTITLLGTLAACSEEYLQNESVNQSASAPEPSVAQAESSDMASPAPAPVTVPAPVLLPPAPQSNGAMRQRLASTRAQEAEMREAYYDPNQTLERDIEGTNTERYEDLKNNPVKRVTEDPVSTFSIDVDTGSYANVRRMLQTGRNFRQDAVRVEEMINYFTYAYPVPQSQSQPFSVNTEIGPTPWNDKTHLLKIGLKGYEVPKSQLPAANLVFLLDVSGSMNSPNKLGLLKQSLTMLSKQLTSNDKVSIVVYAGAAGLILDPTPGNEQGKIINALDRLRAGGSTNGGAGIKLAYAMAEQAFIPNGVNRVILATDGDFNVGTVNHEALIELIESKRKTGIGLTTLGFGMGNYNDYGMEQLADHGNGNYFYIDTLNEARKALVTEMTATLLTIAKDVKIQIEFNPQQVAEYRLIGYENRMLKREDFNNDKIDAGDIGAGHTVTAIYEIALQGSGGERIEPLRYSAAERRVTSDNELGFLKLRYKQPNSDTSTLMSVPLWASQIRTNLQQTSGDYQFAAAVAAFGQQLRGGGYLNQFGYEGIKALARAGKGQDAFGYRQEFINLVELAEAQGI